MDPQRVQFCVDGVRIEKLRIEAAPEPLDHIVVIGVGGVTQRVDDARIIGRSATIVRRCAALPLHAAWIAAARDGVQNLLQYERMFPVVVEIAFVKERLPGLANDPAENDEVIVLHIVELYGQMRTGHAAV